MVQATIRRYYLLLILQRCGISMTLAVYPTFLLANGLNLFEINLVNLVFFTTLFLCEVPTGAFADVFGRKVSFVMSCVLFALSMWVYASSSTFLGFATAEILAGIALTFMSGAFDSWLVDSLKHHGYGERLTPVFARGAQLGTGVGILAALAGAMLYDIQHPLPWIAGGFLFALTALMASLLMKEEYFEREPFSVQKGMRALKNTVQASITYGLHNKNVRFIMLLVLALNFSLMAANMQWQPLFKVWIPNQTGMGFLWAGMALSIMLGAWIAPNMLRHLSERRALLVCQIAIALGIIGTVATGAFVSALTAFLVHEIARGAFQPIKVAYLHDNIPSRERATIVSFESISHHLGGAVGLVMSGAIAQHFSIGWAWTMSGCTLLIVVLLLWRNGK